MAELLLFHHAQGLTVGVGYAEQVGFDTIIERGRLAADSVPNGIVYAGFSLGVLPAQMLAQTRPGAKGAVLVHSCVPPSEFDGPWPPGVPLQIHMMDADEWALPQRVLSFLDTIG